MESYEIKCYNSHKAVNFLNNDGTYLTIATEDREYWFTIGSYKTLNGAIRGAAKAMARHGYTLNLDSRRKI